MEKDKKENEGSNEPIQNGYVQEMGLERRVSFGTPSTRTYAYKLAHKDSSSSDEDIYENTDKKKHVDKLKKKEAYNKTLRYYQDGLDEIGMPYSKESHKIAKKIYRQEYDSTQQFVDELAKMGIDKEKTSENLKKFFYKEYDELKKLVPDLIESGIEIKKAKEIHNKLVGFEYNNSQQFMSELINEGMDKNKAKQKSAYFSDFTEPEELKKPKSFVEKLEERNDCFSFPCQII